MSFFSTVGIMCQLGETIVNLIGQICSTFEVLAVIFWKFQTLAINIEQNSDIILIFYANYRQLVNPLLPKGFYDKVFFPVNITT